MSLDSKKKNRPVKLRALINKRFINITDLQYDTQKYQEIEIPLLVRSLKSGECCCKAIKA